MTPAPLRAYRRRALVWLIAGAAGAALLLLLDVKGVRDDRAWSRRALDVEGRADQDYRGGADLDVTYTNPVTDQRVEATTYVWDPQLEPSAGGAVALEVDPDDPGDVSIAGDRFPLWGNAPGYLPFVAVPLAFWLGRCWTVRRTLRLAASDGPAFAMLAAVAPGMGYRRRPVLHLYPLDAAPGREPVSTVRVLTTAGAPVVDAVFSVEVRGIPRPFARLVARTSEGVLWPAGRARSLTRTRMPRPYRVRDVRSLTPADLAVAAAWRDQNHRAASSAGERRRLLGWAAATGVVVGFAVVVSVATVIGAHADEAAAAARRTVVAQVVDTDSVAGRVTLTYDGPAGRDEEVELSVLDPGRYPVGRRYPLLVELDDPKNARLAAEPYDAATPIWMAWAVVAVPVVGLVRHVLCRRHSARAARDGPYWALDAWPAPGGGEVLLGHAADGYVRCGVASPSGSPSFGRGWHLPGPRASRSERRPAVPPPPPSPSLQSSAIAPSWWSQPTPVVVAGIPEPGRSVAVLAADTEPTSRRTWVPGLTGPLGA